ncbi:hypothetical protein ACIQU5_06125 [Streptomyces sp. NPDC090306]|uniref:hypothetical protein n=1 Tax=Streptomyces sp. NPDC090306 TaxID=3365961 RepID=UPI0037FD353C
MRSAHGTKTSEVRAAYGYFRLVDSDEEAMQVEENLHSYATSQGLDLVGVYRDRYPHFRLDELVELLRDRRISHLVVPSSTHVSAHPILWQGFSAAVREGGGAEIHEVD